MNKPNAGKKRILYILVMVCLVLIDQATKSLASIRLKGNKPIPIIRNVFELYYLENRGAAFSMLQGKRVFFIILTVIICSFALYVLFRMPMDRHFTPMRITLILLLSGAVGNFIDRAFNGYVVDFFYFVLINFPVFNVADIYVTTSEILLVILVLFYYKGKDFEVMVHGK